MDSEVLDIYLDDVNKDYLNRLSFLALFKSRTLGYRCASDLFCDAYKRYNNSISEETLHALKTILISKHIANNYGATYKSDLVYLLRNPDRLPKKMDGKQKTVRKKVLKFFDLDTKGNEYKKEAFEHLKNMRPVKRAQVIDKMVEQFLILSANEYFIEQAAARMIDCMTRNAKFDAEGNVLEPAKDIIDSLWLIGKKEATQEKEV